jgi:hypothetical protein
MRALPLLPLARLVTRMGSDYPFLAAGNARRSRAVCWLYVQSQRW